MSYPTRIRIYFLSNKLLRKLYVALDAVLVGFWLGVLNRDTLHAIDAIYYDTTPAYHSESYNRQGLSGWEEEAVDAYFRDARRLLVGGAGGGREVLALRKRGYEVDGFECNPDLAARANALLQQEGFAPSVQVTARDRCPEAVQTYDGVIVGWGAYMLIQGKRRRIAFLRALHDRMQAGAPLLVSFFYRSGRERRFTAIAAVGNALRFLLGRERLAVGDDLDPNYVHFFTEDELAAELRAGGFEMVHFSKKGYGHAVARA